MKHLLFHIGADRYGLPLRQVVRVLPLLELKRLPLAPAHVAGLLDFHGRPVPVVDLCLLSGLAATRDQFDSRIVLVDYVAPDGAVHLLGLLAERVLGVRELAAASLADSGVAAAPFLGQVASAAGGMVQLVELARLLPAELRAILFAPAEHAA
ncbi:chemotaxis protein CheW [Rugamonas rubra]|uniref:Chemotaxis-related protein WspB n=1 Tax=Rugamonas rubra TaxID=758825 RepID=A0A1I4UHH2_9BURK|nr:chemotaxis protein CheW [Rugamonas rubra]SFM88143.1 chemotaxis-related protein WspB [Rugamonas rubra]